MRRDNGKTWLFFFCLLFQLSINYGCQRHPGRKLTDKELTIIKESCSQTVYPASLYYLDGDCSFCLAKAKDFDEKEFGKGAGTIILFKTSNPVMAKKYIEDISLQSCVILDSSNLFTKSFAFNNIYEISKKGEILSERFDKH